MTQLEYNLIEFARAKLAGAKADNAGQAIGDALQAITLFQQLQDTKPQESKS